jgi:tRNA(fMet)-specific endonuclease VapC
MEIICLDTNILIAHKRAKKHQKAQSFLFQLSFHYQFAVSTITTYELLRGDNQDEEVYWLSFFEKIQILPFDLGCSQTAADIYKELKSKGQLIEAEDLLIGATALYYQMKLATSNVKHFQRIEGLQLVTE